MGIREGKCCLAKHSTVNLLRQLSKKRELTAYQSSLMSFTWFDEMFWQDKPELEGWEPIHVTYGDMWVDATGTPGEQDYVVSERFLRDTYIPSIPRGTELVCLDVEHYDKNEPNTADTISKLNNIVDIWREERPEIKLGYYSLMVRDYWRAISGDRARIAEWRAENDAIRPVIDNCDLMFPSLYTFYDDRRGTIEYMKRNLDEQWRLTGSSKPIYPFVWPRYHESNRTLGGQEIPGDYWEQIVTAVLDHNTGGVVFWNYTPRVPWRSVEGWWPVTQDLRTSGPRAINRGFGGVSGANLDEAWL